jgi:uncharacterized protein (TIGR03437 family)
LTAGNYLTLFLTGLGATTAVNGLNYAQILPTVSIGGVNCPVTYAGRAPTLESIDQINCIVPTGITAGASTPLIVTSNGRASNQVTLAIH